MENPDLNWEEAENEISDEDLEAAADYYDRMAQNEAFDIDDYEEPFVMPEDDEDFIDDDEDFIDDELEMDMANYEIWKEDLQDILYDEYGMSPEIVEEIDEEEFRDAYAQGLDIEDVAAGFFEKYGK